MIYKKYEFGETGGEVWGGRGGGGRIPIDEVS